MGKWKYINLIILIITAVFMYMHIHELYGDNIKAYIFSSLGIILCYALGHYIFVYRMKKQKPKKSLPKKPVSDTQVKKTRPQVRPKARPKVVLKPKPKKDE